MELASLACFEGGSIQLVSAQGFKAHYCMEAKRRILQDTHPAHERLGEEGGSTLLVFAALWSMFCLTGIALGSRRFDPILVFSFLPRSYSDCNGIYREREIRADAYLMPVKRTRILFLCCFKYRTTLQRQYSTVLPMITS